MNRQVRPAFLADDDHGRSAPVDAGAIRPLDEVPPAAVSALHLVAELHVAGHQALATLRRVRTRLRVAADAIRTDRRPSDVAMSIGARLAAVLTLDG